MHACARDIRQVDDKTLQEGILSYAQKQANIRRKMRGVFRTVCIDEARKAKGASWVEEEEWKEVSGLVDLVVEEPIGTDEIDELYVPDGEEI